MPPIRPAKMMVSPVEASMPGRVTGLRILHLEHRGGDRDGHLDREQAPTRFNTPARAPPGFSAPVAIEVAIALPVSWNPLVKSKASAVAIRSTRMISSALMALILLCHRTL